MHFPHLEVPGVAGLAGFPFGEADRMDAIDLLQAGHDMHEAKKFAGPLWEAGSSDCAKENPASTTMERARRNRPAVILRPGRRARVARLTGPKAGQHGPTESATARV